jgi:hypothetical protein
MSVVDLKVVTKLQSDALRLLDRVKALEPRKVVVIAFDKNGEFHFASSSPDGGDALWLMEMAKHKLMKIGEGMPE